MNKFGTIVVFPEVLEVTGVELPGRTPTTLARYKRLAARMFTIP